MCTCTCLWPNLVLAYDRAVTYRREKSIYYLWRIFRLIFFFYQNLFYLHIEIMKGAKHLDLSTYSWRSRCHVGVLQFCILYFVCYFFSILFFLNPILFSFFFLIIWHIQIFLFFLFLSFILQVLKLIKNTEQLGKFKTISWYSDDKIKKSWNT